MSKISVNERYDYESQVAGCVGKFPYPSYVAVEKAFRQMRRRRRKQHNIAYRCCFCGGWHMSNPVTRLKWQHKQMQSDHRHS